MSEATRLPFSSSTQKAMDIARSRALNRKAVEISSLDVLVGIFRSHPQESEPSQLLEHVEVAPRTFSESCEKLDGGFGAVGTLLTGTLGVRETVNAPASEIAQSRKESVDHSSEVVEIFAAADKLVPERTPDNARHVRLRDLFGGLLMTQNVASSLIASTLGETFLPLDEVRKSYPEFLQWRDQPQTYKEFLAERHPPPRFPVSGFAADIAGDEDLIGIGPDVHAMAYLITAKSLIPPLAIGLFGDWGSGKSFFMGALRRRINKITDDARLSARPQRDIDIYKYVVQIEFNAWHYVEGELWASLVEHILRNLHLGTKDKDKESELQLRKKHWIDQIHKTRLEEADIAKLKKRLGEELDEKNKEIEQAEQEAESKRRELEQLTARDVWDVVTLTSDDEKDIREVIGAAGLSTASESAVDLASALEQSRQLLQRGNVVLAPLRASGWRGVAWVGVAVLVAFIGPLLSVALRSFDLSEFTKGFVALGGFASAAAAALATANGWMRKWLEKAEGAKARLDKRRAEKESEFLQKVAKRRTEQAALMEDLDQARKEGQQKRQEIRELEQELDGLTPGRVLLDFINERVGSEDYRKHLGVAALIRRDFDKLSDLINESNESYKKSDTGTATPEDEHRINRIVLYIDDLDRCPPKRVVEVLQAVHLLMAFPLFVVIVAVDSRWLSQSLNSYYDELLTDPEEDAAEQTGRQATPHDYLEKIFQIPFWIKALPEEARKRIVQGLVAESLVSRKKGDGRDGGDRKSDDDPDNRKVVHWDIADRDRPLENKAPTDLQPRGLEIQKEELAWMEALRAILGQSPRAVKRFVNVYRLIKASAAVRVPDFVGKRPDADYKRVLFLLAVVTGLNSLSTPFFRAVVRKGASTLRELVKNLETELHKNGRTGEVPDTPIAIELAQLKAWLASSEAKGWNDVTVDALGEWVRQVARYSYRIELG